ncbi:uncharacterized protein LOC108155587 isoform X1 [Drosophila miranda]|uniref:uncharacterized protein LOC108155587 isoform X1 n=1 Tax=Drosophila miranda TaxID=7229 RepID=UPI0007E89B22|nr:uncharacterized protein LOC108155587 isoform X1 [Drosophila miranda]
MNNEDLQLFFWNTIYMFHHAYFLNIYKLYGDLIEVKGLVDASGQEIWIRNAFTLLTTILLVVRFIMTFAGLTASVVAIYPILTNSMPEMLIPTIIVQGINDVVLNCYELLLGYGVLSYLFPRGTAAFAVLLAKMVIKITWAVSNLNYFASHHNRLFHLSKLDIGDAQSFRPSHNSLHEYEINNQNYLPN